MTSHLKAILRCERECRGDPFNVQKWKMVCCHYGGDYPLKTRREMMILNIPDDLICDSCGQDPCLWITLGDKLIDMVGIEFPIERITPDSFREKLETTFLAMTNKDALLPKCCRERYHQLFPNKQLPMIKCKDNYDMLIPNEDEYDSDKGPFWIYEDDLFCH